ncbi:MAG: hypothetical protein WDW38_000459 [Sanguina aurantia]
MEHDNGFLEVEDVLSLCWENGEVSAPLSITEKLLLTADAAMAPFSFNQHVDLTLQNIQQKREERHMAHTAQQHGEGLQRKYHLKALMTQVATDHLTRTLDSPHHVQAAAEAHASEPASQGRRVSSYVVLAEQRTARAAGKVARRSTGSVPLPTPVASRGDRHHPDVGAVARGPSGAVLAGRRSAPGSGSGINKVFRGFSEQVTVVGEPDAAADEDEDEDEAAPLQAEVPTSEDPITLHTPPTTPELRISDSGEPAFPPPEPPSSPPPSSPPPPAHAPPPPDDVIHTHDDCGPGSDAQSPSPVGLSSPRQFPLPPGLAPPSPTPAPTLVTALASLEPSTLAGRFGFGSTAGPHPSHNASGSRPGNSDPNPAPLQPQLLKGGGTRRDRSAVDGVHNGNNTGCGSGGTSGGGVGMRVALPAARTRSVAAASHASGAAAASGAGSPRDRVSPPKVRSRSEQLQLQNASRSMRAANTVGSSSVVGGGGPTPVGRSLSSLPGRLGGSSSGRGRRVVAAEHVSEREPRRRMLACLSSAAAGSRPRSSLSGVGVPSVSSDGGAGPGSGTHTAAPAQSGVSPRTRSGGGDAHGAGGGGVSGTGTAEDASGVDGGGGGGGGGGGSSVPGEGEVHDRALRPSTALTRPATRSPARTPPSRTETPGACPPPGGAGVDGRSSASGAPATHSARARRKRNQRAAPSHARPAAPAASQPAASEGAWQTRGLRQHEHELHLSSLPAFSRFGHPVAFVSALGTVVSSSVNTDGREDGSSSSSSSSSSYPHKDHRGSSSSGRPQPDNLHHHPNQQQQQQQQQQSHPHNHFSPWQGDRGAATGAHSDGSGHTGTSAGQSNTDDTNSRDPQPSASNAPGVSSGNIDISCSSSPNTSHPSLPHKPPSPPSQRGSNDLPSHANSHTRSCRTPASHPTPPDRGLCPSSSGATRRRSAPAEPDPTDAARSYSRSTSGVPDPRSTQGVCQPQRDTRPPRPQQRPPGQRTAPNPSPQPQADDCDHTWSLPFNGLCPPVGGLFAPAGNQVLQVRSSARSQLSTRTDASSTPVDYGDLDRTSMLHGARESGLEVRACMYLWTHLHPKTTALPRHPRGVRQLHSAPDGPRADVRLQHSRGSSSVPHPKPAGSMGPSSDPSDSVPAPEGGGRAASPGKASAAERAGGVLVSSEFHGGPPSHLLASHNPRSNQHHHRTPHGGKGISTDSLLSPLITPLITPLILQQQQQQQQPQSPPPQPASWDPTLRFHTFHLPGAAHSPDALKRAQSCRPRTVPLPGSAGRSTSTLKFIGEEGAFTGWGPGSVGLGKTGSDFLRDQGFGEPHTALVTRGFLGVCGGSGVSHRGGDPASKALQPTSRGHSSR